MKNYLKKGFTLLAILVMGIQGFAISSGKHSGNRNTSIQNRIEIPVRNTPSVKSEITNPALKMTPVSMSKNTMSWETLNSKQRHGFKKELRGRLNEARKNALPSDDHTLIAILLAIIIPPLGVWYYEDGITTKFWIDLILTLLFWVPGVIFALLVVLGVI